MYVVRTHKENVLYVYVPTNLNVSKRNVCMYVCMYVCIQTLTGIGIDHEQDGDDSPRSQSSREKVQRLRNGTHCERSLFYIQTLKCLQRECKFTYTYTYIYLNIHTYISTYIQLCGHLAPIRIFVYTCNMHTFIHTLPESKKTLAML